MFAIILSLCCNVGNYLYHFSLAAIHSKELMIHLISKLFSLWMMISNLNISSRTKTCTEKPKKGLSGPTPCSSWDIVVFSHVHFSLTVLLDHLHFCWSKGSFLLVLLLSRAEVNTSTCLTLVLSVVTKCIMCHWMIDFFFLLEAVER